MAGNGQTALDLNETIAAAVKARVEAEVFTALSGDEVISRYVSAALQQPVETTGSDYRKKSEPYISKVLRQAIQAAAKDAVVELIQEELPSIKDEIRKAIGRNKAALAETMAQNLADAASRGYGIQVALELRVPESDR